MVSELKQKRLELGYSIEYVSDKINIRKQYIIDIEEENFDGLPGRVYVDGYVRIYSKFLGVDNYLYSYDSEIQQKIVVPEHNSDYARKYQKYFLVASVFCLGMVFAGYGFVKSGNRLDDFSSWKKFLLPATWNADSTNESDLEEFAKESEGEDVEKQQILFDSLYLNDEAPQGEHYTVPGYPQSEQSK